MIHLRTRWIGLLLLAGISLVQFRDLPDKLDETAYLGWLYPLLVAGCAVAGPGCCPAPGKTATPWGWSSRPERSSSAP